jgi:hypothetical protein
MTDQEIRLMGEMLRASLKDALDPIKNGVENLERDVTSLKAASRNHGLEIQKLKDTDRKHSGVHREISQVALPQVLTKTTEMRDRDMDAVTTAYERMLHLHDDLSERLEISQQETRELKMAVNAVVAHQQLSLVKVPDGKGGIEVKAASVLAATSSQKNEGAIAAVAVDTANTKADTTSIKGWTKAAAGIGVFVPILAKLIDMLMTTHGK